MDEKDIAIRLAQLRVEKGVSARDMSLSIGQNEGYINNIENGKSKPSLGGILYICEYLGITPSQFFDMESTNPRKTDAIVKDLRRLSNEQLDIISALVKELVKNK